MVYRTQVALGTVGVNPIPTQLVDGVQQQELPTATAVLLPWRHLLVRALHYAPALATAVACQDARVCQLRRGCHAFVAACWDVREARWATTPAVARQMGAQPQGVATHPFHGHGAQPRALRQSAAS